MPPGAKTREGYRAMEKTIGRKLIAERAGVSMRTVTRVLQGDKLVAEQTRLRVLEVVDELGYTRNKIAGNLSRNKNSRRARAGYVELLLFGNFRLSDQIFRKVRLHRVDMPHKRE